MSSETRTFSSCRVTRLTAPGAFVVLSFAFASYLYLGGQTVSETLTDADTYSFQGKTNDTVTLQTGHGAQGLYAGSNGSGVQSSTQTTNDSFTNAGSDVYSETVTDSDIFAFYEAGVSAGGSFNLSSVTSGETYTAQFTYQGGDTRTQTGVQTQTGTASGSGINNVASNQASENFTSLMTVTGTGQNTSTDSYSGSGSDSFVLTELGSFANFSAAYGSVVYKSGGSYSQTAADTATSSFTGTSSESRTATDSFLSNGIFGDLTKGDQVTVTLNGTVTSTLTSLGTSTDSATSSDSWSLYEAGSYAYGSYAYSSVNYQEGASDSWSATALDSATDFGQQGRTALGTVASSQTVGNGLVCMSNAGLVTIASNQTISGLDTTTSSGTVMEGGSDCWALTEQGSYAATSYSLSSIVYQGTHASNGTLQQSRSDSFWGTYDLGANDSEQHNNGASDGPRNSTDLSTLNDLGTLTVLDLNGAGQSLTDIGSATVSWYEAGSEAGGSYAFTNVLETFSSQDSFSRSASASGTETTTLAGSLTANESGSIKSAFENNSSQESFSNSSQVSATFQVVSTAQASSSAAGSSSYALNEQGSFGNGSYAFGSYVLHTSDGSTFSSQQTTSVSETLSAAGTFTADSSGQDLSTVTGSVGGMSITAATLLAFSSSAETSGFLGTVQSTDTNTASQQGTFSEAQYQAGSFAGGSYALSSMTYDVNNDLIDTSTSTESSSTLDTLTGYHSQTASQVGLNPNVGFYDLRSSNYTGTDTRTYGHTYTSRDQTTYTLYEAGTEQGGLDSLSSYSYLLSDFSTYTYDITSTSYSGQSGTALAEYLSGPTTSYYLTANFSMWNTGNTPAHAVATTGYTLSEQGTYGNGGFALSSFALTLQQSSTATTSASSSATQSSAGTDSVSGQSGPYTGLETLSTSGQETSTSSATLSEQGSYAAGTFTLTAVTYSGSGSDQVSTGNSDNTGWSGSLAGNQTSSASAGVSTSFTVQSTGCFAGGSWGLSSFAFQGASAGAYSSGTSEQQTFNYQPSGFGRSASGQECTTLYQAGTQASGAFSNASYNYQDTGSSTASDASQGQGAPSSETWTEQHASTLDATGVQTVTSAATYTLQGPSGTGLTSNQGSTAGTVALPSPVVQPGLPDGSLVPASGADVQAASGGGAPVAAAPNLGALADLASWLQVTQQLAGQAASQSAGGGSGGQPAAAQDGLAPPELGQYAHWGESISGFGPGMAVLNSLLPKAGEAPNTGQAPLKSFGEQVVRSLQPLFRLLYPWAGGKETAVEGQVETAAGYHLPQYGGGAGTTGDPLVDWVDGMLNGGGPLTAGSATVYGTYWDGQEHTAGQALSMAAPYVQAGVMVVAGMWLVGPAALAGVAGPAVGALLGAGQELATTAAGGGTAEMAVEGAGQGFFMGALMGSLDAVGEIGGEMAGLGSEAGGAAGGAAEGGVATEEAVATEEEAATEQALAGDEQAAEATQTTEEEKPVDQELQKEEQACTEDGGCFAAGTPLLTPAGDKAIDALRPGDLVLSAPEDNPEGPPEPRQVEKLFVRRARLMEVRVGGQSFRTTAQHRFWVRSGRWQGAARLQRGDELGGHDGGWVVVEGVRDTGEYTKVYNLRVAEYHTYFVGSREWGFSVWAHNTYGKSKPGIPKNEEQVHPDLPVRKDGDPTNGVLYDEAGNQTPVVSGRDPKVDAVFEDKWDSLSTEAKESLTHAEGHAASEMVSNGTNEAWLVINYKTGPCRICREGIPELLGPGQRLWVQSSKRVGYFTNAGWFPVA